MFDVVQSVDVFDLMQSLPAADSFFVAIFVHTVLWGR